jgi:hypothetical protein
VEGSCEHDNKRSGSIKYWEILERLRNWRLLMKGSTPWSYLVCIPVNAGTASSCYTSGAADCVGRGTRADQNT